MTKKNVISVAVIMAIITCVVYAGKSECKKELPEAIKSAIKALYPAGEINKFKKEKESLKLYEVEIDVNGTKLDIDADADGTIAEVETNQDVNGLPAAVAKAAADKGGKIVDADKEVVYAELKLVKLDAPVTMYEIKIEKDGKMTELKISGDGKVLAEKAIEEEKICSKEEKKGTCKPGCKKPCCKKDAKTCSKEKNKD